MADALLEKLRTQRITLPFKNGEYAKIFFDLVDENEKHNLLLFDKSKKEERCYSYSYKIDVGFFTKIFIFKDDRYNEEIKIDVSIYNNVIVISSSSDKDNIMGLLYQYKEYYTQKHYAKVMLMEDNYNEEVPVYYTCGKIQGRYIKPIKIKQKTKPILVKKEIQ